MIATLASVGLVLLMTGIVVAACGLLAQRLVGPGEHLFLATGLVGLAAASFAVFLAYWIAPLVGLIVSILVLACSATYLVIRRAWTNWRPAIPVVALVLGIALLYLGILYLWPSESPMFTLAGTRFSQQLPVDNMIPVLFSDRLLAGQSTHALFADWNGSDRPPLQSGLILLVHPIGVLLGAEDFSAGASVVAELLWIPALFALISSVARSRMLAIVGTLAVAVTGTALINTLYTWPKMLSAALVLCSCVLLLEAVRARRFPGAFVLAVLAFVLAVLAHGAAAFALPLVLALGVRALRGQVRPLALRWTAVAGGLGLAVYLPWLAYQRFADSPGDRLARWHLAGVIPIDPRPFLQTLIESYRALSPANWWSARTANLVAIFDPNPLSGVRCFCADDVLTRRTAEFFTTSAALGLAYPLLVLVLLLVVVRRIRRRSDEFDRRLLVSVALSLACIALWWLMMFLPGSTIVHQGSHVWILLLVAAPAVWLAHRRLVLGWVAVGVQAVLSGLLYLPLPGGSSRDAAAMSVALLGMALVVAAVLLVRRQEVAPDRGLSEPEIALASGL